MKSDTHPESVFSKQAKSWYVKSYQFEIFSKHRNKRESGNKFKKQNKQTSQTAKSEETKKLDFSRFRPIDVLSSFNACLS